MGKGRVIVVGAGPVGGVVAWHLASAGIDVTVIEAGGDCAIDLRASTFHPPTLEMLDTLGVTDLLLGIGLRAPVYHWRERRTGEVFAFDMGEIGDVTRYPFRLQCEQYHLARLLADRLAGSATARVLFNHRAIGLAQDDAGVRLTVETPTEIVELAADYVIGADGANSLIRKWLRIAFEGFTWPEKFLCLTTSEPLEAHLSNLAHVNYVSDPEEWAVLLRVPSLWRVLVPASESDDDAGLLSDAKADAVFTGLIGRRAATAHRTIYRVHQRVAQQFRIGRAMIIGDAAHLNNPLGGFGMNSGIHDAFDLAPRLVRILTGGGDAEAELLAFNTLRHRVTRDFVQAQTIANMALIKDGSAAAHDRRRALMADLSSDPAKRRAYLLRQSMIEMVRSAQQAAE